MKRPANLPMVALIMPTFLKRDLLQASIHPDKERRPAGSLSICTRVYRSLYIVHLPDLALHKPGTAATQTPSKHMVRSISAFFLHIPSTLPLRNTSHEVLSSKSIEMLLGSRSRATRPAECPHPLPCLLRVRQL